MTNGAEKVTESRLRRAAFTTERLVDRMLEFSMSLPTGSRLGQYEILAVAGAGGMGIVYKARDTRLGRLVAIKLVPEHKLTDSDRNRRFIQEARAASSLNHPNIVVIYDL